MGLCSYSHRSSCVVLPPESQPLPRRSGSGEHQQPRVLQPAPEAHHLPPTPPGPGEIIPFPTPSYGPVTLLPFYTSDRPEKYDLTFYCNAGEGRHLTTPGPRWPPRDYFVDNQKTPVLVVVEDGGQPGYLRWYWAYR